MELVASVEDGRQVALQRALNYRRPAHPNESQWRDAAALRERLRLRTVQTDLLAERQRALATRKSLELTPVAAPRSAREGILACRIVEMEADSCP